VDLYLPTELTTLPLSPITNTKVVVAAAAAGGAHTLISTVEGDVYAVGANEHGQLGVGDLFDRPTFTLIASFRDAPGALFNGVDFRANMGKQHVNKVSFSCTRVTSAQRTVLESFALVLASGDRESKGEPTEWVVYKTQGAAIR